jgi:hypothetical protein
MSRASAAGALEAPIGRVAGATDGAAGEVAPRAVYAAEDKSLDARFRCAYADDRKA